LLTPAVHWTRGQHEGSTQANRNMAASIGPPTDFGTFDMLLKTTIRNEWERGFSMTIERFRSVFPVLLTLTSAVGLGMGQSTLGTIVGPVPDPSGSAMPLCKITIHNTGTDTRTPRLPIRWGTTT
jgi:hypothetical protein